MLLLSLSPVSHMRRAPRSCELRAQEGQDRSSALLLSNKSNLAWQERIQLSQKVIHLHMSNCLLWQPSLQSYSCSDF